MANDFGNRGIELDWIVWRDDFNNISPHKQDDEQSAKIIATNKRSAMILKLSILYSFFLLQLVVVVVANTSARLLRTSNGPKTTRSLGKPANLEAPSDVVVHRINCGVSSDFTDSNGIEWSADAHFVNGFGMGFLAEFFGFGDSKLFETYREEPRWFTGTAQLDYEFPVDAGSTYAVEMMFPQRFNWSGLFPPAKQNIYINGVQKFSDLELIANDDSPPNTLRVQTASKVVGSGNLLIQFESSTDSPVVSAIVIYKVPPETLALPTVSPTATPSAKEPTMALLSPSPTTLAPTSLLPDMHVNVGGSGFVEADGTVWVADTFNGGANVFSVEDTVEIEGTENDALYRSEVYGDFSLSVPVEMPGVYKIVMHFAELYHGDVGSRIFDIKLEGETVLSNVDLVARTRSKYRAIEYTFIQSITDGAVDIVGVNVVDKAKLSGVEIFFLPEASEVTEAPTGLLSPSPSTATPTGSLSQSPRTAAPTTFTLSPSRTTLAPISLPQDLYINVGGSGFVEADGTIWMADTFNGGANVFSVEDTVEIEGTDNDAMYRSEVYGDFSLTIPVEMSGEYKIVMHFAELYHGAAGSRIFDIELEGETVLTNVDLVARTRSKYRAIQYTFIQSITDGAVDIVGVNVVDKAKLNGVEIAFLPEASEVTEPPPLPVQAPVKAPVSVPVPLPALVPIPVLTPIPVISPSDYAWQLRLPLPIDLGEMAAASDGQYVYVLTGHLDTWSNIRSLYRYDPASNSWTTLAEQNVVPAVNHATVQYVDGKIYQIGGFSPETNEVAIYDIATNTWSKGTPLKKNGSAYTLASASNAVIDGKIYMAGGLHDNNANGNPPHTFVYDPKDGPGGSWKQLADMPAEHARNHGCGVSYNGKLYVFAGRRGPNGGRDGIESSLVYDPASDSWSMLPDIPTPRAGMANCVELNGELYVIGGENPGTVENNVEAYNPVRNEWIIKEPMQVGRHGIYPVKRGNTIHVVGGGDERDFSNSNWHEVYAPSL